MRGKRRNITHNCIYVLAAVALLLTACSPATGPDAYSKEAPVGPIPAGEIQIPDGMYRSIPSTNDRRAWGFDEDQDGTRWFNTSYNAKDGSVVEERLTEAELLAIAPNWSQWTLKTANDPTSTPAAVAQAPTATPVPPKSTTTPAYNFSNPDVLATYSGGVLLTKGAVTKALKRWGDVYPVRFNSQGRVEEIGLVLATNRDASIVVQHVPRPGEGGMGELTIAGGQWRTLDLANASDVELVNNSSIEVSTASYYTPPSRLESLRYRWHVWEDRYPLGAGALKVAYTVYNIGSMAALGAGLAGAGIGAIAAMGADDAANLVARGLASTIDDVALNYGDDAAKVVLLEMDDLAPYLDDAGRVALNGVDDAGGVWVENNLDDFLAGLLGSTADDVGDDAAKVVVSGADDVADDVATQVLERPQILARTSPSTGEMIIPDTAARAMGLTDDALGLRILQCPPCPQGQARVLLYRSSLGGIGVFPVGREVAVALGAGDDAGMILQALMAGDERALTIVGLANLDRVTAPVASQGWQFVSRETKSIPLLGALGKYFESETWHLGP